MKILRSISLISISAFLLIACSKDEQFIEKNLTLELESAVNNPQNSGEPQYVPNEILVKFKAGTSSTARARAFGRMAASVKEHIHTAAMKHFGDEQGVFVLKINENALQAIEKAKAFSEVEFAEPNWIYQHQATSNDPRFTNGSLWGMYGISTGVGTSNSFGCGAATAWANGKTGTSTVWVGIIDEGYMFSHPDLEANAGMNPYEIAGNGKDDDNNGRIDDIYGWDFFSNDNSVYDAGGDSHGTHVAGTIGAVGGNGVGVAGVVWNVKFLSGKFLGSGGGSTSGAIAAVDYFTSLKNKGLNIVATNNSWGGGGYSSALYSAIERANQAGVLFIAAAGNSGKNIDKGLGSYPAGYNNSNVISVASITSTGSMSSFSSFGPVSVDLGAPGSGIWSTVPGGYASYNGTSMATPHVTGAAALYKSINPNASASVIKAAILNSGISTSSLSGKTVTGRRLNVSGF